jgi:electron transfer flavoprotein beta subunit
MKSLVLVKHVPDSNSVFRIDRSGTWVDQANLSFTVNDFDRYALEELLKLKDAGAVQEVVALTVGPAEAAAVLRACLATGADRGIHVKDDALPASDPFAVARAIHAAIASESFSLIVAGLQAEDDNHTQVGGLLAGLLEVPYASAVVGVSLVNGTELRVERELENNELQVLDLSIPAVLAVQTGMNNPRYASLKGIMAAKKKAVATLSLKDIGLDAGSLGPRLRSVSLSPPPKGKGAEMLTGSPEEIAKALVSRIRERTGVL